MRERDCMIKSSQSRAEMQSRNMHANLQEYKFYIIWMRSKSILKGREEKVHVMLTMNIEQQEKQHKNPEIPTAQLNEE